MAQSSPGQHQAASDSMNGMPVTDISSDRAGNVGNQDSGSSFEQQNSPVTSPSALQPDEHASIPQESGNQCFEEPMLLEKPSSLCKPLDLDKGYEYGPAVLFAPGFFTQRPTKRAPVDDNSQVLKDASPPFAGKRAGSSLPHLPSLGRQPAENATSNRLSPLNPSRTFQTQPVTLNRGFRKGNDYGNCEVPALGKSPQLTKKPPFPDTPPSESPAPSTKARSDHVKNPPVTAPKETALRTQAALSDTTGRAAPAPELRSSPHAPHSHHHGASRRDSPGSGKHASPLGAKNVQDPRLGDRLFPPTQVEDPRLASGTAERGRSHMVNRPVREVAHTRPPRPLYRRPESRSSNVSKQRSRCGSLASSPLVRQRRVNINHEFTTSMAGVINQFTQQQNAALEEQKAKYHKYIRRLKRDFANDARIIAQQTSQLDAQTKKIEALQESEEQFASQLKDMETKLGTSEDRARRLEEKYRACKTHLNSAIQEQQDLYTRSKKQWAEAIDQMRAMEKSQSAEAEMAVRKAEVIREQMVEKVRQAIAQNKSEAHELYGRIDALTQQVEEKEVELCRERESVHVLTEKFEDLRATSSGFEALAVQGKEILHKIGEQQIRAEEHHQKSAEELRDKLDAMASRLEALTKLMSGQPAELAAVRHAQEESMHSVTSKLDGILESRNGASEATNQLSTDLEHHMEKIWQRLDNQIESLSQQLAEKAEENGMVSTLYRRKEAECEEHLRELALVKETAEKQTDQIHELEANLDALDAAQDESEETIRRLEASGTEAARLSKELECKTAAVAELQRKLDAKEKEHASELQNLSSNTRKLAEALQEKDRTANLAVQQAVETSRREALVELEAIKAEAGRKLEGLQHEQDSLLGQLETLKRTVHAREQSEAENVATIRSLQERLAREEAKEKKAAEQLAQCSANLERLETQLVPRAEDLEAKLKAANARLTEVEGERRRQCDRAEALIAGLERWAHKEGHDGEDLVFLRDGSESEAISAALVRLLGASPRRQRSRSATLEAQHEKVIGDEESRSSSNGRLSQECTQTQDEDPCLIQETGGALGNEGHAPEGDAAENAFGNDPLPYASTLHHLRRVVVRSPANVPNEPAAPSIDQEKTRRREAMQPKSIMKRVTRSTSFMMKQGETGAEAGHGPFKRSRQDGSSNGVSAPERAGDGPSEAGADRQRDTRPTGGMPERPSKRQRSDTAKTDHSIGHSGISKQGMKRGSSASNAAPKTQESQSELGMSATSSQGRSRTSRQQQPLHPNNAHNPKPAAAWNSRSNLGGNSKNPRRTPSAADLHPLRPKQPNVRTYGSQRTAVEPSAAGEHTDSRFPLRSQSQSQSQSRYWTRPKEEESMTFSQGVGGNENLLLPL